MQPKMTTWVYILHVLAVVDHMFKNSTHCCVRFLTLSGVLFTGYYVSGGVNLGKFLAMELLKYIILALMFVVGFTAQV